MEHPTVEQKSAGGLKPVLKGLAMLAVFGGLVFLARALGLEQHLADRQWILSQVEGQGALGVLFFLGLTALVTGMGVPRQLTAFLGGFVFGWFWGALLSTLGTAIGCAADFALARTLGRDFVLHRFGRRVAQLDAFLHTDPWRTSLAIRLFPVGHNLTTNVAAGVTSIPALPFILASHCLVFLKNVLTGRFRVAFVTQWQILRGLPGMLSKRRAILAARRISNREMLARCVPKYGNWAGFLRKKFNSVFAH